MPNYINGFSPYKTPLQQKEKPNMQYVNPEHEKCKMKDYPVVPVKEQLQRTARAVHDVFVASAIDKIEEAARNGLFDISVNGTSEEIEALAIYCRENDLYCRTIHSIGASARAIINWNE